MREQTDLVVLCARHFNSITQIFFVDTAENGSFKKLLRLLKRATAVEEKLCRAAARALASRS